MLVSLSSLCGIEAQLSQTMEWRFLVSDKNECDDMKTCTNHGACRNVEGSYHCTCTQGWFGKNCEKGEDLFSIFKCFRTYTEFTGHPANSREQ